MKVAVLISGAGTNMAALLYAAKAETCPYELVLVASNDPGAPGLKIAAAEGIIIQAQTVGKIKMWAQSVAIVALLVAAANGIPPVSNFGQDYPYFRFWEVTEVQVAFSNLAAFDLTSNDWKVFGYLVGRGSLWAAVVRSIWSRYNYFSFFFTEKQRNLKNGEAGI